jgi:hypothetical protein
MICLLVQGLALFLSDFTIETTYFFRIWDLSVAWDDATVFVHIPYLQPMGGIQSGVQLHEMQERSCFSRGSCFYSTVPKFRVFYRN